MSNRPDMEAMEARCSKATEGPWEERWLPVPGYEGIYDVSDFGNVRSHLHPGNHKLKLSGGVRLLRQCVASTYPTVCLGRDGKRYRTYAVHRLVMAAFVGPRPQGKETAHLNGNPRDNRLQNLQYVTHKENEAHKRQHGSAPIGEHNGIAILQGWQIEEIKYLASKGIDGAKLANLFDTSRQHISDILLGHLWPHVSARTDLPAVIAYARELERQVALTEIYHLALERACEVIRAERKYSNRPTGSLDADFFIEVAMNYTADMAEAAEAAAEGDEG